MQETLLSILQPTTTTTTTAAAAAAAATSAAELKEDKEIELLLPPHCHLVASRARSQPSCRRVTPTRSESTAVVGVAEKVLPNGDIYTGTLSSGSVPHGKGKYLWSDGCMYEGEWKRGRANGRGKFSWPSGATYEGQFKDGRMNGYGTFIGVDGDSYKGNWLSDRKHGFGEKRYGNGDGYEGWWRFNLQDGEGKYKWSNGNEYAGEWRHGVIHGKGVLVWANGNRYEGHWENGVPKGKGAFTFANNNYRNFKEEPRKRLSVDANFPRICIWELDGEAGDITCDIVDNVEASSIMSTFDNSEDSDASGNSNCKDSDNGRLVEIGQCQRSPCSSADADVKKPGQTISKGHKNYDLMLNLQLGIRCFLI